MDRLIDRVAGLDVHKATVVATVRTPAAAGGRESRTETFGTMTADLIALRDWLHAHGVTHVALESTGVYWKPIYYVLEDGFQLLLINMLELKHVPGRKTDVKDSEWLAQLLECGLLRASFVPPPAIRELRDITRYQVQQVRDRSREVNRLCKVLEDAGIKLTSVATDVLGVSGRAMVDALLAGTTDPTVLAELARGKLRKKLPELRRALQGRFRRHHAFLVEQILAKIDFLDETLDRITAELDERLAPPMTRSENRPTRRAPSPLCSRAGGEPKRSSTSSTIPFWTVKSRHSARSMAPSSRGTTLLGSRFTGWICAPAAVSAGRPRGDRRHPGGLQRVQPCELRKLRYLGSGQELRAAHAERQRRLCAAHAAAGIPVPF